METVQTTGEMIQEQEPEVRANGTEAEAMAGGSSSVGAMQGIPGRRIKDVGLLDLRGVPADRIAQIQSIDSVGAILLDEGCRTALEQVRMNSVGTVAIVGPDVRVIVEACMEFSKATLEAMPGAQELMLIGIVFFAPDTPPALVTEKFASLQVIGILLAGAGVQGALLGKMQITGVTVTLKENADPIIRCIGQTRIDAKYLSYLQDGIHYLNVGQTILSEDVPEELLAAKIATYYNVGQTTGPAPLLSLLQARCPTNLGQFQES